MTNIDKINKLLVAKQLIDEVASTMKTTPPIAGWRESAGGQLMSIRPRLASVILQIQAQERRLQTQKQMNLVGVES